jgi:hypothetical protein
VRLTLQWLEAFVRTALDSFISPGDIMHHHRDYGDEDDFDVVTSGKVATRGDAVNQTPKPDFPIGAPRIEPVVGISRADSIARVLEHGVEVGDFRISADGSLEPIVPRAGHINHTWVRVLVGELLIATGRNHDSPEFADFPENTADLLRDLVG